MLKLVAKWQDAHMPAVIKPVQPEGYRVTFFDVSSDGKPVVRAT